MENIETLSLFVLYVFLFQLSFSSCLPHLYPKDQTLALLEFKNMFDINLLLLLLRNVKTRSQVIELDLKCSQLQGKLSSNSSIFQLYTLKRLDLSINDFSDSHISPNIGRLSSLTYLDLSYSMFTGQIPSEISHLSKLHSLRIYSDLSGLTFGPHFGQLLKNSTQLRELEFANVAISSTKLSHLPNLTLLDLSRNSQLIVSFPITRWNSSASLKVLSLYAVNFTKVPEPMSNFFGPIRLLNKNWTQLEQLQLSSNFLTGSIPSNFKSKELSWINLGNNHLQSPIPNSLLNQENLIFLSISSNNLSDNLNFSMFSNLSELGTLNLSYNSFSWTNENQAKSNLLESLHDLDLRSNLLQGSLPIPPSSVENYFISHYRLSEHIPSAICNLEFLTILDLASNSLKGAIPPCFGNMNTIEVLDLRHNNLSGTKQTNFSVGNPLRSFNLRGNKLEGKIPRTLINCKRLEVLDLGNNELNDTFPMWLGTLPNVMVLSLRSNKLHGPIKTSKTKGLFPQLRMIDISSNGFYGDLPTYLFENFQAMKKVDENMKTPRYIGDYYYKDSITISSKGLSMELVRIFILYTIIDLSSNRFEGSIPSVIRGLTSLVVVNISHNSLEGHIPTSLGSLSELQSLDLSFNKLSGEIPRQLTSLTFLGFLSVSHNHLVGCIPEGNQFGTFPSSSFEGNDGLRGCPLSKDCGDHGQVPPPTIPSALDNQ
ncbi:receptor-like protein Cf-9 [Capsicum galapagoense]